RSGSVGLGMHEQGRQAGAVVGHLDGLDAWMADDGRGVLEDFDRRGVDGHAALRARMDETLAGLIIARPAPEAGCRRQPMAFALLVAAARRDLVSHAGPLFEPGGVVADVIFERASDAINFVDLDTDPGRGAQANEQAHGPAVVGRKIKEGGVVFAADHVLLPCRRACGPASALHPPRSTDDWITGSSGVREGATGVVASLLFAVVSRPPAQPSPLTCVVLGR